MAEPTDTIVISRLKLDAPVEEFIRKFSDVGFIKTDPRTGARMADIRIGRDEDGKKVREAMVTYTSAKSASEAITRFNGETNDGTSIRVEPAMVYFDKIWQKGTQKGHEENNAGYHWFNWIRTCQEGSRDERKGGKSGGFFSKAGKAGDGYIFHFIDQLSQTDLKGKNGKWGGGGGGGGGTEGKGGDGGDGKCVIS